MFFGRLREILHDIPGSGNPEHIKENLDLFGFELTDDEMEQIAALDCGEKHDWY